MIVHIVLIKWKNNISPETIQKITSDIAQLKSVIPSVKQIYCGENFSKWNEGYTHAIVAFFENRQGLEEYRNHPTHLPIAKIIDQS